MVGSGYEKHMVSLLKVSVSIDEDNRLNKDEELDVIEW